MCYVLKWTQGNGYRCGCCRSTYDAEEDYDTWEEAMEAAKEKLRQRKKPTKDEMRYDADDNEDLIIIKKSGEWNESEIEELINKENKHGTAS